MLDYFQTFMVGMASGITLTLGFTAFAVGIWAFKKAD